MTLALRRCLGCSRLVRGLGRSGRCDECRVAASNERERDLDRAAHKAARYDAHHRRLRRHWAPYVAIGSVRCGRALVGQCLHAVKLIRPGESWDLDHVDELGRSHPSHADCNRAARRNAGDAR